MGSVLTAVGYLAAILLIVGGVAMFSTRVAVIVGGLGLFGLVLLHDPDRRGVKP